MWGWASFKIHEKTKICAKEYDMLNDDDTDTLLEVACISKANAHREHSLIKLLELGLFL